MPLISIVIPAFNEEKLLGHALQAIQESAGALKEAGHTVEIVVCDNNSTDRTAEIARAAGARVVFEPVNQIGRARNTGAAAARGEWLVFVDADSYPSRQLFAETARVMAAGRAIAGGAPVKMDRFHWRAWILGGLWNFLSRLQRWVAGSYLFCEAAAFRELGGFNLDLYAAEEIELSKRLKRYARERGRRMVILRTPLVTSARKLSIYSRGELLGFLFRATFRPLATIRNRSACALWYDGRR